MDHIINSQRFSPAQLHLLNCCRKYLQVTTISDITLPDGIRLEPNFELGNHSPTSPKCRLHWFYQERPPDDAWKLWQRANCLWSDEHGNLTTPLGAWLFPPSQQRMKWPFYYDSVTDSLYAHDEGSNYRSYFVNPNRQTQTPINSFVLDSLPHTASPVTVSQIQDRWQHDQAILPILQQPPLQQPESFDEYLSSLAHWEKELFRSYHTDASSDEVISYLTDPSLSASDGSVWKPFIGAFGWILRLPSGKKVSCAGPAFGYRITSYRAEAYGILSYLRFLYRLKQYW